MDEIDLRQIQMRRFDRLESDAQVTQMTAEAVVILAFESNVVDRAGLCGLIDVHKVDVNGGLISHEDPGAGASYVWPSMRRVLQTQDLRVEVDRLFRPDSLDVVMLKLL
jgi:hypothetical protein